MTSKTLVPISSPGDKFRAGFLTSLKMHDHEHALLTALEDLYIGNIKVKAAIANAALE